MTGKDMNDSLSEEDVVQTVLKYFRDELGQLKGGKISRVFMGNPPTQGYVQQFSSSSPRGRMAGEIVGKWLITPTEVTVLDASFIIPSPERGTGMYYDVGTYNFAIASDRKNVDVGWSVGPRYGRGFRFEVALSDEGKTCLKMKSTLWMC